MLTSHYAYSRYYGFNTSSYMVSALNVNLVYDTRDNMINASKGIYALASWRGAFEFMGNRISGNFFQLEWRSFHGLSKKDPRHLLAFWLMGNFSPEGEFPYLTLPATGMTSMAEAAAVIHRAVFGEPTWCMAKPNTGFLFRGAEESWVVFCL